MTERRYQQSCPIARALDAVGERWALLIVRELLLGPVRYGQLLEALPSMGTKVLAERLKELAARGLIDSSADGYRLTERGEALRPVIAALAAWGQPLLAQHEPDDATPASTVALMLWGRLLELPREEWNCFELRIDDRPFVASITHGETRVARGESEAATGRLSVSVEGAIALLDGRITIRAAVAEGTLQLDRLSVRRVRELFRFAPG
ncbi:MAG: helix-turn-helix transcriptional regulator [Deltaproteobacteria bacterium]|nr:helix-turn-helix transcriptional regulator [Nannocystaceae bacterium]